jgi:phosphomannomutase
VILPKVHLGRDAPVGIGLTLQHLLEFGGTLSALKASLPGYSITKGKVDITGIDAAASLRRIEEQNAGQGRITKDDGLKIDFPDSWVHLRKSNTEPIIRIIAEAPTKSRADELVRQFTASIRNP